MSKSRKSVSSSTSSVPDNNLSPLLMSIMDAVVRHTNLDQEAVETLRRALASIG